MDYLDIKIGLILARTLLKYWNIFGTKNVKIHNH